MELQLALSGIVVGALSGFFGIGGGTILVPILLFFGLDMKAAVGISVVQMVFSSIFGSVINHRRGTLDITLVLYIGIGGFLGAISSAYLVKTFSSWTLEAIFLLFVMIALMRLYFKNIEHNEIQRKVHPLLLVGLGSLLGMFSIAVGVGGSVLLVPLLVGFLHVKLKNAISAGLFFVVFSSIAGLMSLGYVGMIDYTNGIIVGVASLGGVYMGIWLKHQSSDVLQKRLLIVFYIIISLYLLYRLVTAHG